MQNSSEPDPIELNMSDVLATCDGHSRDMVLALLERGSSVTLGEIADVMGLDAGDLVRQIVGGIIAGAAIQLLNERHR